MTAKPKATNASLLCSFPGCGHRWTCNFRGRYCGEHDPGLAGYTPAKRQARLDIAMPLREALPPFNERAERDGDTA